MSKAKRPTADLASRPYRPGVGMMLLDRRGRVFVGRRLDQTAEAWQMPQGGIDPGEEPRQTALRELAEEIGTDKADIIAESCDWLTYDLPADIADKVWKGRYRGQKQKWFALRFRGRDSDINLATAHPEFEAWRWAAADEMLRLIVPFKRALYERVVGEFRHLLT
ncbi:MAG TPA: RNA pyrophosphohydrolase [Candidatus Sulfotelmatobacter sp.]|nr:RNA pyrophosphohydrolase [Candidatus Sulfotelmatobacter sp.]